MPDLSLAAAAEYWFGFHDPMIYRVITFMDSVESWTLDGDPTLENAMTQLGQALDQLNGVDLARTEHEETFIQLLANIKTSRGLRLLQAIDLAQPGSASKVLMYAENNQHNPADPAGFFLKRNITFERLRLLARAFSNERVNLIEHVLEGDE